MQTLETFNDNYGTAILSVGPAGSGKSCLGVSLFPGTYCSILDPNFSSARRWLEKKDMKANVVGYDTILFDEKGTPVPPSARWDRFWTKTMEALKDPRVDAIFVDGASQVTDCIIAKIVQATTDEAIIIRGGKETFAQWGSVLVTWRAFITKMRQSGKKLVLAAHERKAQDESDQIWKYSLLIPGQTGDTLPNLMSDVWRTEVEETPTGHVWWVRCLPNIRHEYLKNTFSLPAKIKADELVQKIQQQFKKS